MQQIEGETLAQEFARQFQRGPFSEAEMLALVREILTSLAIVHREKIIHCDLKPANLIRRQSDRAIVLIDFGGVKDAGSSVYGDNGRIRSTNVVFTPGYCAPEQARRKPILASDVYAVGCIALEALTGRSPVDIPDDPKTGELLWQHLARTEPAVTAFLQRLTGHRPADRYANAIEALAAIELILGPAAAPPPRPGRKDDPTVRVSPGLPPDLPSLGLGRGRKEFLRLATGMLLGAGGAIGLNQWFSQPGSSGRSGSASSSSPKLPPVPATPSPSPTPEVSPPARPQLTFDYQIVTVDDRGNRVQTKPGRASFFNEDLGGGVVLSMVNLDGGRFEMGSPPTERGRDDDEGPQHWVTIAPFAMGRFPVTQAQWRRVMKTDPSSFKGDDRPVEQVSWLHAMEFCARLFRSTGRAYRLPTEAEWEYACRAGTTTPFHFGPTMTTALANYKVTADYGRYANEPEGTYRRETTNVGSFGVANAFGLYDLHGNDLAKSAWLLHQ